MASADITPAPKKVTLGLIIGWALGIFLLLPGISLLVEQTIPALMMLISSCILLPPIMEFIQKKCGFHLSSGVKVVLVVVLIGITVATMDRSELRSEATIGNVPTSKTDVQEQEQVVLKSYVQVFTFSGNGAKKSEPFTIHGKKFRIKYDCNGSFCSAWLKKPSNKLSMDLIMNTTGSVKDESVFYGSGEYYIESNAIGTYSMVVEDYRLNKFRYILDSGRDSL